mmetsp:Transcript_47187/g.112104  ORF Transcript_47187/g.112104 Transcript_47187/m.112104 type:complete len:222 (-) Transcript_47187:4430-5095(-)
MTWPWQCVCTCLFENFSPTSKHCSTYSSVGSYVSRHLALLVRKPGLMTGEHRISQGQSSSAATPPPWLKPTAPASLMPCRTAKHASKPLKWGAIQPVSKEPPGCPHHSRASSCGISGAEGPDATRGELMKSHSTKPTRLVSEPIDAAIASPLDRNPCKHSTFGRASSGWGCPVRNSSNRRGVGWSDMLATETALLTLEVSRRAREMRLNESRPASSKLMSN